MPLLDRKSPSLLAALATIGIGVSETQAAGPRDYDGPQGWSVDGDRPPPAASPTTPPTDDPARGRIPGRGRATEPSRRAAAPPPEEDTGCADGDFCVEDLTDDADALAKETAPKAAPKPTGPVGTISGRMLDAASGSPLIGVNVTVPGTDFKTKTDIEGRYLLPVPPGTYQVRIWYDAYEGMTISGVVVEEDALVNLDRELRPIAGMTQTVAVTAEINKESAAGKLVERKKSVAARDMMSRDDIRKSGGGATSAVARRIVGSTIVGDRFLFVRGLGHRYGNTLFDGARLPSPDPNLRTVPLDIFPSGALSAINVQKTATPDVPADFAGASVQLESREPPEKWSFQLDARFGVNTATSFRPGLRGDHFAGDNFTAGNLRSRPARPLQHQRTDRPDDDGRRQAGVHAGAAREVRRVLALAQHRGRSLHRAAEFRRQRCSSATPSSRGAPGSASWWRRNYANATQTLQETHRIYNTTQPVADGPYVLNTTQPRRRLPRAPRPRRTCRCRRSACSSGSSTSTTASASPTLYTRDADNESRVLEGRLRSTCGEQFYCRNTRLRYTMRSVLFTRLGGKHEIPAAKGFTVEWFGSYAQARQDDPLLREMLFNRPAMLGSADGNYNVEPNESGKFQFFKLLDHTGSGALDFTVPFKQWGQLDVPLQVRRVGGGQASDLRGPHLRLRAARLGRRASDGHRQHPQSGHDRRRRDRSDQ